MGDYARGKYNIIEQPFRHGKNLLIGSYVHIRPGVTVGDNVELRDGVWIGPGASIGSNVRIFNKAVISTEALIGNNIYIGPRAMLVNTNFFKGDAATFEAPIVENNVRIAAGAILLPSVVIREGCIIAVGAVVTKSTEPNMVYMGVPAKAVRKVNEYERNWKIEQYYGGQN